MVPVSPGIGMELGGRVEWRGVVRICYKKRTRTNICGVMVGQRGPDPTWQTCPGLPISALGWIQVVPVSPGI